MSFLLDTNVISEWVKPSPNAGVVRWLAEADEDRLFLSVITFAELRHGIERLQDGGRRKRLDEWLHNDLPQRFEGRVLAIDAPIAENWGIVVASRQSSGRPIGPMDAFIAATAQVHRLALVTRNESDFTQSVPTIINPWKTIR
ncbi:MAG TPA: type II toxin-antitoxin system VapC family toxin [Acetobacteraceae bacterium]